jgi:ACR3 family arsenite efflux pump ArsB
MCRKYLPEPNDTWFGGRKLKLPHAFCSPAALIGASNFFELAVAVAIALFGFNLKLLLLL